MVPTRLGNKATSLAKLGTHECKNEEFDRRMSELSTPREPGACTCTLGSGARRSPVRRSFKRPRVRTAAAAAPNEGRVVIQETLSARCRSGGSARHVDLEV